MDGETQSSSSSSTVSHYRRRNGGYNGVRNGHSGGTKACKSKAAKEGGMEHGGAEKEGEEEETTNFFVQVWEAIVTFIAGPPVLPNLAFILLLVAVVFLLAKTIANNEELRLLRGSPRRETDPFSRAAVGLRDGRNIIVGERVPQFGSGRFRLGGVSTYEWPVTSQKLLAITQNPALVNAVDADDPTDRLCDHCADAGVFETEAARRLCVWALCPGEDGGYCRAFDIATPQYKECRACAASPSKREWIRGRPPKIQENLPVCIVQTISTY